MSASLSLFETRRIAALHEQGFSDRWIARRFQTSTKTVSERLQEIRSEPAVSFPLGDLPLDEGPPGYDPVNIRRCRGCGALVYLWPCLACCLAEGAADETTSTSSQP